MSYVVTPGSETRVNTTTYGSQSRPAVATFSDGGYVVAWESYDFGTDLNIYAQRYNASGTPLGSESRVNNSISTGHQVSPAVAALTDGGYVVIWSSVAEKSWESMPSATMHMATRSVARLASTPPRQADHLIGLP